jgi:FixJ family two-component response regulator
MMERSDTVFVVDDDPAVREALQSLLRSVGLRVELFESVPAFRASQKPDVPSCLVLDVRLPGKSGLEFQDELQAANIPIPIIFITGHGDIRMSVRAMKAGAAEFLTKPFRDQELLDAIESAILSDRSRRKRMAFLLTLRKSFASITPREREVMAFVVAGHRNKKIAAEIGVSEVTVKTHRAQVMRKMGAASLAELIRMAEALDDLSASTPSSATKA